MQHVGNVKAFNASHRSLDYFGLLAIEHRITQIIINMERRRWMEDDLGRRYVFVNLADQFLKVVSNGKTIHVYVCHLKSKMPTSISSEGWYEAATHAKHRDGLGAVNLVRSGQRLRRNT